MITAVLEKQKSKKFLILGAIFFVFFMGIYTMLDNFNGGYQNMANDFGVYLVVVNISLNVLMSFLSALMFNMSTALFDITKKEGKGTFVTMISVLFGVLTYGCTSCVIAFFAVVGITFSVAALPLGWFAI